MEKGAKNEYNIYKEHIQYVYKYVCLLLKDKIDSLSKEEFEVWMRYHLSTCEREDLQGYSNYMLYICKKN